jgi:hypothetical protein
MGMGLQNPFDAHALFLAAARIASADAVEALPERWLKSRTGSTTAPSSVSRSQIR